LNGTIELDDEETQRDGFFATVAFNPPGPLWLTASIEDNSIDDPYTLSSPTDGRRYKIRGRYHWDNGLAITASYRRYDLDNDLSGWAGDTEQTDLRLAYQTQQLHVSLAHGLIDYTRSIDQLVTGGSRQDFFPISYGSEARFIDGSARWRVTERISIGGYARTYDNDGSYPLARDDWRAFAEIALDSGYLVQLAHRRIDYTEDGFDDYDADLIELAVGFRW